MAATTTSSGSSPRCSYTTDPQEVQVKTATLSKHTYYYSKLHSLCPLAVLASQPAKEEDALAKPAISHALTSISVEQVPPSHAKIRLVVNYLVILVCQSPIISQVSLRREVQRHNEVQRLQHVQVSDYKSINYKDLNLTITTFHHFSESLNPKPR